MMLEIGTRVYNAGDICNPDHYGTITGVRGRNLEVTPDDLELGGPYWVTEAIVGEYNGTHSPRIATAESVRAFREARRADFMRQARAIGARYNGGRRG